MEKSNKELAVSLACAALNFMSNQNPNAVKKPLSGEDIKNLLSDCYRAICDLDSGK